MPYPLTLSTIFNETKCCSGRRRSSPATSAASTGTPTPSTASGSQAGQRARAPRREAGRAGRHLRMEQPPAPRGVFRRPVHGLRPPHRQHPALRGPAHLHRQPRGGRGNAGGRGPVPGRGGGGGPDSLRTRLRDHERQEDRPETKLSPVYSYEALLDAEKGEYDWPTASTRTRRRRSATPRRRRETPRGCRTPTGGSACTPSRSARRTRWGSARGTRDARRADVPRERLGDTVRGGVDGDEAGIPGLPARREGALSLIGRRRSPSPRASPPCSWGSQLIEQKKHDVSSLKAIVFGGSAAPRSMIRKIEKELGIPFIHAYGMTETYPVVLLSRPKSYLEGLPEEELYENKGRQGTLLPCLEMRVVAEDGSEVPRDGNRPRGASAARAVDHGRVLPRAGADEGGDPGRMAVHGRRGDGGSGRVRADPGPDAGPDQERRGVDLLHRPREHDHVPPGGGGGGGDRRRFGEMDGAPHGVRRAEAGIRREGQGKEILAFLAARVAKWWMPDEVVFVDAIPKTSVGKFAKRFLRERFKEKRFA